MYTKEVVTKARERLAQRRGELESRYAARVAEAYRQVPELSQIDIGLRSTVAQAAQAVFAQGGDPAQALDAVKRENLSLQARRRALVAERFGDEGYLDEPVLCATCGGTGYVGSTMCGCLAALCAEEQRRQLGAIFTGTESFETFRLDFYSAEPDPRYRVSPRAVMEKNLENCRRYAKSFGPASGNLLLSGGTGLGKTHLALAIGRAVGEQGVAVCYETAIGLFSKLEKAKFSPTEENRAQAEQIERCGLLIVDDLGTEMPGQFVTAALYGLLNERLMANRPMVITTNLTVEEAGKRYSPQIASRLYGEFTRLAFLGSDIRVLKQRGQGL